jgi:hypothetical protein
MSENRAYIIMLLIASLLCSAWGVLHGQEPDPWYLISEPELLSIENYKETSEREKESWLLLVQGLRQGSESLNAQLSQAREAQKKSQQLFEQSEAEKLIQLSLKNGEIANLKEKNGTLETSLAKSKGQTVFHRAVNIFLGAIIVGYIAIKVLRFLKI